MEERDKEGEHECSVFTRHDYCYEENKNMSRRVGDVESKIAVIKAEFLGVKDQVFTMQSMMVKLGETSVDMKLTNELIRAEMRALKEQVILMNSMKDTDGIISVARRIAPLVAVAVQLATFSALVWGFVTFAGRTAR